MIRLMLTLALFSATALTVAPRAEADTADMLNQTQQAVGYPIRPANTDGVQRRADEIVEIYQIIKVIKCPQTKAFTVGIMARNGALARGIRAGKGIGF